MLLLRWQTATNKRRSAPRNWVCFIYELLKYISNSGMHSLYMNMIYSFFCLLHAILCSFSVTRCILFITVIGLFWRLCNDNWGELKICNESFWGFDLKIRPQNWNLYKKIAFCMNSYFFFVFLFRVVHIVWLLLL